MKLANRRPIGLSVRLTSFCNTSVLATQFGGVTIKKLTLSFTLLSLALFLTLAVAQTGGDTGGSATEGFVERPDGARIYYQVQGEGEPMMLIHGYPLNSGLFRDNVGALVGAGYQVVTPDLRGFGQSEAPNGIASIETYAADMFAVMDELELEQATVLGMSMGGWTLFEMYSQAPERFTGLIFNDTAAIPAVVAEANLWLGTGEQARQVGVASLVPFLMKDMLTGDTRQNNPELVSYLGSLIEAASVNGASGGGVALALREDNTDVYSTIEVPTLILFGLEDTLTPVTLAQNMADAIPNATLEIIPGASHASIIEAAELANQIILNWARELQ